MDVEPRYTVYLKKLVISFHALRCNRILNKEQNSDNPNPYFISTDRGDRSKKEIMCYDKDDPEYGDIQTKYEDTVSTPLDSSSFRV